MKFTLQKCLVFLFLFTSSLYAQESSTDYKHTAFLGFDLVTSGSFEDGTTSSSSTTFDSEINFESAFSIGYEYQEAKKESWGKAFGVSYHTKREVDSFDLNGETLQATGDAAEITMLKLNANLIYRWDIFYIPFGINLTTVSYDPPANYDGTVDSTGGLGFNFGLGWFINDQFAIEYMSSSSVWELEADDGSTTTDFGDGILAVATLRLKYIFDN